MSVAAIILAAGASRRLGEPKQLLKLGGETLVQRASRVAREGGASPVFIVLGARYEIIRATINFNHAAPVRNENWEQGIATSIHAGLDALESTVPDAGGALMMSCDQPRLTSDYLRSLIALFTAQSVATIAASSYAGVAGIPAVFPRAVFSHLRALRGDKGARALIAQEPCPVITLPFPGGEIDIDSPEDLAHLE